MSGGYYDPETSGSHKLDEEEFGKALLGSLGALVTAWSSYLGAEQVRQILFRVATSYRSWSYSEGHALDLEIGEDPWSFAELVQACEVGLVGYCLAWSAYLGVDGVLRELRYLLNEGDWEHYESAARAHAQKLITQDEIEAADAASGETN